MNFGADSWWIFGLIVSAAVTIISFFLKRTINQADDHEKSINEIKRTYVTKDEMKDLFALSEIVVSRAGANAICELLALHKPNVLIPLPASASTRP